MKKSFNEDSYINIDEDRIKKQSQKVENISDMVLKMNRKYENKELTAELLRRKQFNFLFRLRFIEVDYSSLISIFSFSQDKFINQWYKKDDWQLRIFGLAGSHLIRALNFNPKNEFPEIANGYLGIKGFSDEVQMSSLFSGSMMETHRAAIPSWTIRNITAVYDLKGINIVTGRRLDLDMSNGRLIQILFSDYCLVEQHIYAHQTLKSLIVHEILVQFLSKKLDVVLLQLPKGRKRDISPNIHLSDNSNDSKYIKFYSGKTHVNDMKNHEQEIYAYFHEIKSEMRINYSQHITKYYFLMSVNENNDIARQNFNEGMTLMEDDNRLFKEHESVWKKLWSNGAVFLRRSDELDVPLLAAQYLINSNLPSISRTDTYGAMGATGLGVISNQGVGHSLTTNCGGRIEYTQELWMLNSQILLNPRSVKSIINKRISHLPISKKIALDSGYKGAKYPASTDETGEELCEENKICKNMYFPTGLVAMALHKYLLATGDKTMFNNNTGIGLLLEVNEFYKSILEKSKLSGIESVPVGNVNLKVKNSIFDIGLMKESLMILPTLVHFFEMIPPLPFVNYLMELQNLSQAISIPFDSIRKYHHPYDSFNITTDKLYLPDGVMLRYPLDHLVDIDFNERNLKVYEKRMVLPMNPMSLSIMFINNMDADQLSNANSNFQDLLNFCNNTFKIWTNDSSLWKGSYLPSAAGYLDSVMFGLLGIRIRQSGLYLFPKLILDISFIEVASLEYLGSVIKIVVDSTKGTSIQVISSKPSSWKLGVMDVVRKETKILQGVVTFPLGTHIVIRRLKLKTKS